MVKRNVKHQNRSKYSEGDRQIVVATILEHGAMTYNCWATIQALYPGLDKSTAWRWWQSKERQAKAEHHKELILRESGSAQASNLINNLLTDAYMTGLQYLSDTEAWEAAGIKDRAVAFGILEDKRMRAVGFSPQMVQIVKQVIDACRIQGFDPEMYMNDILMGLTNPDTVDGEVIAEES